MHYNKNENMNTGTSSQESGDIVTGTVYNTRNIITEGRFNLKEKRQNMVRKKRCNNRNIIRETLCNNRNIMIGTHVQNQENHHRNQV
jgi:hypothetical protein